MKKNKEIRILIVDDEAAIRQVLKDSLNDENYSVDVASDGDEALAKLGSQKFDIIFLDIWMNGEYEGMEVLDKIFQRPQPPEVVMMSGHGTIDTAVKATKLGAWDFLEKPLSMDKVIITINNIINLKSEKKEKESLLIKLRNNISIVGNDSQMVNIKKTIAKVAKEKNCYFSYGETGTGKELIAQNLHFLSSRAGRPFVQINCSTLPEDLVEMEFFGYVKGAFTGAESAKKGKFKLADGGTIYLENIEALNLDNQKLLAKYINDNSFKPVGGDQVISSDIFVATSSLNSLEVLINQDKINKELYDLLKQQVFEVPSLRDRSNDISALIAHFSEQFSIKSGYRRKVFSEKATKELSTYSWKGNVTELKNFIERIYILTPGDYVDVHDIHYAGLSISSSGDDWTTMSDFRQARAHFEKEFLTKKIAEHGGNISKTAESIGLERSHLHRKIKVYQIEVE